LSISTAVKKTWDDKHTWTEQL